MDLEAQAKNAKIQAVNFFNEFKEVEKTANTALSNSISLQSELSTVQIDLKSLIESLQVNFDSGVQNIQNQINEVTNVIVQEQGTRKSETEALEQQIFAQEDQLQKNVKGKKAKKVAPDSFAGKMRQKLREKAKENASDLGLLGAGLGLAALGSGGNFFTNLLPENPFKNNDNKDDKNGDNNNTEFSEENPPEGLRRVLTGLVDFVMFGATDMDYRGDLFGGNEENTDGDDEEITEGINTYEDGEDNEEKKFLGVGFSDLKETFDILTLKPIFDQFFPNDKGLLNMFNNKKENGDEISSTEEFSETLTNFKKMGYNPLPIEGGSTYGDPDYNPNIATDVNSARKLVKDSINYKNVTNVKYMAGGLGGFIPGDGKGGSTYGDPNYDPYSAFKLTNTTDNNSNGGDEVIDGGTTVIEGGTEVVDGGTVGNNQRGEVRASTSLVKSANSPVTAVKLSETNSIKELAIGA